MVTSNPPLISHLGDLSTLSQGKKEVEKIVYGIVMVFALQIITVFDGQNEKLKLYSLIYASGLTIRSSEKINKNILIAGNSETTAMIVSKLFF